MKGSTILQVLGGVAVLLLVVLVATQTRWEEVEIEDPARGLAASDEYYSLRHILEGAGSTLEVRTSLEPLPPTNATLYLDSSLWNIFPERDAHLRAWVESGGHLVLLSPRVHTGEDDLHWVPLTAIRPRNAPAPGGPKIAPAPRPAASDGDDDDEDEDDEDKGKDKDADDAPKRPVDAGQPPPHETEQQRQRRVKLAKLLGVKLPERGCADFSETGAATQPAFEPGRVYRGCTLAGSLRALGHVEPTWTLASAHGTLAMRVPVGRGNVTGVTPYLVLDNHDLLQADNGLIAAAVLQAAPGRPVWIVRDEAREPLLGWLWHEGRTPLLLALAAIALSLWRLMVRFGPREAPPPQARRSMGEQVRGTGQFIAGTDAQALHAATRKAFEDVARTRVEGWAELGDAERIAALAVTIAHSHAIDQPALLASLNIGGGATKTQILTAIAVLEQARRALLRAPASPFVH
jgi:hypothetical protein